jgi:septum formation protein
VTRVILASGSPRRRELLAALVDTFEVVPSGVEEPLDAPPVENALRLARDKARDVLSRDRGAVVIGADTIVFLDGRSYEKPAGAADALRIWRELRGRTHGVVTGVAIVSAATESTGAVVSDVTLNDLPDEEVRTYVASGRPMDKAGAYAIQDEDVPTVRRLEGCYCNVMGLPLWTLRRLLERAGVATREPSDMFERCRTCPDRESSG